jgi:hypothetical protein
MNGVHYRPNRKKWIAMLNHDRQRIHLGQFDTFEEAQAARLAAEKRYAQKLEEAKKAAAGRSEHDSKAT